MSTRYRIRITRIEDVPNEREVWRRLTEEAGGQQYGYVRPPQPLPTEEKETMVYEQESVSVDVVDVILAVNGLPLP